MRHWISLSRLKIKHHLRVKRQRRSTSLHHQRLHLQEKPKRNPLLQRNKREKRIKTKMMSLSLMKESLQQRNSLLGLGIRSAGKLLIARIAVVLNSARDVYDGTFQKSRKPFVMLAPRFKVGEKVVLGRKEEKSSSTRMVFACLFCHSKICASR